MLKVAVENNNLDHNFNVLTLSEWTLFSASYRIFVCDFCGLDSIKIVTLKNSMAEHFL